jgi:hypothetical protein
MEVTAVRWWLIRSLAAAFMIGEATCVVTAIAERSAARWRTRAAGEREAEGVHAAEPNEAPQKPVVAQRLFASPDEAIKALQAATEAKDKAALREIFGPEFHELSTGDEVQDANNAQKFATPWRRAAIL